MNGSGSVIKWMQMDLCVPDISDLSAVQQGMGLDLFVEKWTMVLWKGENYKFQSNFTRP